MVTSSAVVGSSATSTSGSTASAAAIIARWRRPPESWKGYSSWRRSASGMPTASSSSSTRLRAAAPRRALWRSITSRTWRPTVSTGLRAVEGSWKIIATRLPRTARIAASGSASRSWPVEPHLAPGDARHLRQQAQDGERGHRLAAARLAHQREALARADLEVHAVHRAQHALGRVELRVQARDCEGAHTRTRGSKPSRTASANRFAASTSANMKTKAAASDHHTIGSRAISRRAALIMVPKLVVDGSTPTPT